MLSSEAEEKSCTQEYFEGNWHIIVKDLHQKGAFMNGYTNGYDKV